MGVQELCATPTEDARAPWAVTPVERPIGGNDVGIVAWRLALRTPESPCGREVRSSRTTCLCQRVQLSAIHKHNLAGNLRCQLWCRGRRLQLAHVALQLG